MIKIGTSGFSYPDWVGNFYPLLTDKGDMLNHYATIFDTVEINSTYYNIPHPIVFRKLADKVPDGFEFTVKAHKSMTHERNDVSVFDQFNESVEPLKEEGKLATVLAQFPWGFKYSQKNLEYLSVLPERMPDIPVVVEFRNVGWLRDDVFSFMRERHLNFSCVDEPKLPGLIPPTDTVTGPVGYVRFHSRNAEKWWGTSVAERYDYLYSEDELTEWIPRIKKIAQNTTKTYIFFNNCHHGKAAINARQVKDMLMLV